MTLVDSNVLIDIFSDDPIWFDWSSASLSEAILRGPLFINDVIFAETSIRYRSVDDFDEALTQAGVEVGPIPRDALFLAGKMFQRYRRAGGSRLGVLPDFFIGAHAAVRQIPILTRDTKRYRTYFPTVKLITPDLS